MHSAPGTEPATGSRRVRRWAWLCLSYGLALGCLYWVFHGLPLAELLHSAGRVRWAWVVPAIVLDLLVYFCAAWEWQLLLLPAGRFSLRQTTLALFAGRFANDVLPMHAGYIIRLYLISRWSGGSLVKVVPSLLVERLFDASWLVLSIGLTTVFFPLPGELARGGQLLGGLIVLAVGLFAWMVLRRPPEAARQSGRKGGRSRLTRRLRAFSDTFASGVRNLGRSWVVLAALGLSILKLALQAMAFLSLLWAYHFPLTMRVKLAVFLVAYVGMSLPSTPASLGVFQLFCSAGLRFFGMGKADASAFALLAYVVLTVPLAIAGLIAFVHSGLSLRQVKREVASWTERRNSVQKREGRSEPYT